MRGMVLVLVVGFLLLCVWNSRLEKEGGLLMKVLVNWYRNREVNFKDELQYVPSSLPLFSFTI